MKNIQIGLARVGISNAKYMMNFKKQAINRLLNPSDFRINVIGGRRTRVAGIRPPSIRPVRVSGIPRLKISIPSVLKLNIGGVKRNILVPKGNMINIKV